MKNIRLFSIALLLLSALTISAQVDTDFWFAAPRLSSHDTSGQFHLMLFSYHQTAQVTIDMPADPSFTPIQVSVPAQGYTDVPLATSWTDCLNLEAPKDSVANKGLHIVSTEQIGCYFQVTRNNGESYTLKGQNALGTSFVVGMQNQYQNYNSYSREAFNGIQIIATQDSTDVTITPNTSAGYNCSTQPLTVRLDRGQTYAYYSCGKTGALHLTGTTVTSTQPIAINSSDDSADPGYGGQDLIGDQILPDSYAGTEYVAVGHNQAWEGINIIALQNNTTVTLGNGTVLSNLQQGDVRWVSMSGIPALYLQSDAPVVVFQVTGSNGEMGGTMLPQLQCTGSDEVYYKRIPGSQTVYINLMTKTSNIGNFTLNGNAISSSSFSSVPGTNNLWSYASINASSISTSQLVRVKCTSGIFQMGTIDYDGSSMTYGFFSDYSYRSTVNVSCNGQTIRDSVCTVLENQHVDLVAGIIGFANEYTWTLPDGSTYVGDSLHFDHVAVSDTGRYYVIGVGSECGVNPKEFTFQVIPYAFDTLFKADICQGDIYSEHGFSASETGEYQQKLEMVNGCDSIVRLQLTVHPLYFVHDTVSICRGETYSFNGQSLTEAGQYEASLVSAFGCDSVIHLILRVDTVAIIVDSAKICDTESYEWFGQSYNKSGKYTHQEPNSTACGYEQHILILEVSPGIDVSIPTQSFSLCMPEADITIPYQVMAGECYYASLLLSGDTLAHGMKAMTWSISATEGDITIPLDDSVWPGEYEGILKFYNDGVCFQEIPVSFSLLYGADSTITQRWGDFLSVRKPAYDYYGGFEDYQWYENGELMPGQTGSQLYLPEDGLNMSSGYSVAMTRVSDGVRVQSCDFYPADAPSTITLAVVPSLMRVDEHESLQVNTSAPGRLTIFNQSGVRVVDMTIEAGSTQVDSPAAQGMYMV